MYGMTTTDKNNIRRVLTLLFGGNLVYVSFNRYTHLVAPEVWIEYWANEDYRRIEKTVERLVIDYIEKNLNGGEKATAYLEIKTGPVFREDSLLDFPQIRWMKVGPPFSMIWG